MPRSNVDHWIQYMTEEYLFVRYPGQLTAQPITRAEYEKELNKSKYGVSADRSDPAGHPSEHNGTP